MRDWQDPRVSFGDLDLKAHDTSESFSPQLRDGHTGGESSAGVQVDQALPDGRDGFVSLLIGGILDDPEVEALLRGEA